MRTFGRSDQNADTPELIYGKDAPESKENTPILSRSTSDGKSDEFLDATDESERSLSNEKNKTVIENIGKFQLRKSQPHR